MSDAQWESIGAVVSDSAGVVQRAFVEALTAGDPLPDMPLFLEAERYVNVPLEETYHRTFDAVPQRWRERLAP